MSAQCCHSERSEGPHKGSLITQVTSRVSDRWCEVPRRLRGSG
jgi:hypothetical protein